MTAVTYTMRQPIAGNQQANFVSDTQQHPLVTRANLVLPAGREVVGVYGKATANLGAGAAATIDPATGNMAATGGSISGTTVAAISTGQFGWITQ